MKQRPTTKPRKLEKNRPRRTFSQPDHKSTEGPADARPAPPSPATSAWVSLVGIPRRAARLDQTIRPVMAPPIVVRFTALASIIPWPIVAATAVPDITPARLKTEAMAIAWRGDKERVPTTVAMALGASVQPFTNSAPRISKRTATSSRLIVLSVGRVSLPSHCLLPSVQLPKTFERLFDVARQRNDHDEG